MASTFVVWNPRSGRAREAAEIRRRLTSSPRTVVRESSSGDDATRLAKQAVSDGFDVIVAAGGDGTVNSVANALVGSAADAAMAVLPIGTANDFALTLAVPDELEAAAELIASGQTRSIDMVEVETDSQRRFFTNVASGGNSDRVTEMLTDELKQAWGPLCYLRGALEILSDLESYQLTVSLDEGPPFDVRLWNIIIANGRTNAGHLPVAPRANPEDGLVDVILIQDGELADVAAVGTQFALGDYLDSEQVIYRQAKSLSLASKPEMRFSIDGEAIQEQPVAFSVLPGAIRMIVGPDYTAEPPA